MRNSKKWLFEFVWERVRFIPLSVRQAVTHTHILRAEDWGLRERECSNDNSFILPQPFAEQEFYPAWLECFLSEVPGRPWFTNFLFCNKSSRECNAVYVYLKRYNMFVVFPKKKWWAWWMGDRSSGEVHATSIIREMLRTDRTTNAGFKCPAITVDIYHLIQNRISIQEIRILILLWNKSCQWRSCNRWKGNREYRRKGIHV